LILILGLVKTELITRLSELETRLSPDILSKFHTKPQAIWKSCVFRVLTKSAIPSSSKISDFDPAVWTAGVPLAGKGLPNGGQDANL
jgi:hypothetical protein